MDKKVTTTVMLIKLYLSFSLIFNSKLRNHLRPRLVQTVPQLLVEEVVKAKKLKLKKRKRKDWKKVRFKLT